PGNSLFRGEEVGGLAGGAPARGQHGLWRGAKFLRRLAFPHFYHLRAPEARGGSTEGPENSRKNARQSARDFLAESSARRRKIRRHPGACCFSFRTRATHGPGKGDIC